VVECHKTKICGVHIFNIESFNDERGEFFKPFTIGVFNKAGLEFSVNEEFYSISKKNVIRGMHFQTPPFEHNKTVCCISGGVLDVVLDLRLQSETFGVHMAIELSSENRQVVWIPKGVAHGFLSLQDNSIVAYKTDGPYSAEHDKGVHWDSFGMCWGNGDWIISARDKNHPSFADFITPF
jgi:dTDP-4-dehydrorhamnose 3,5-epimerase